MRYPARNRCTVKRQTSASRVFEESEKFRPKKRKIIEEVKVFLARLFRQLSGLHRTHHQLRLADRANMPRPVPLNHRLVETKLVSNRSQRPSRGKQKLNPANVAMLAG